ncbi:hypothetical protein BpHYR1_011855 [Brachionus plicatilis]|uniref:Uncharacterized protein n=1 Tax=Brachionus plicatilis TaxID=10195 RepID=A0A3M7RJU7_BRAPC|nr:hypothetical protein BpHYR1_011855 [Brachionus plicatilis]
MDDDDSGRSQSPAELAPVIHYFENNYIGLVDPEYENCSRVVPKYHPGYWNLRKRIQKGLPRSNNSLEAWHKSLLKDVGSHPDDYIDEINWGLSQYTLSTLYKTLIGSIIDYSFPCLNLMGNFKKQMSLIGNFKLFKIQLFFQY